MGTKRKKDELFMPMGRFLALLVLLAAAAPVLAEERSSFAGIKARVEPMSRVVPIGQPVWVRFSIENTTDKPVTLTVEDLEPEIPSPEVGLPLTHVFSGASATGISVTGEGNRHWETPATYRHPTHAPILMIGPHSSVGSAIDLRDYFAVLRSGGNYRVQWAPYKGRLVSDPAALTIAPRKQVTIVSDKGTMTLELFYDDAPLHVENFIELVGAGFYTGKTFHRLEPGYLLQGGCPKGDGTGIRLDGKRIPAEINGRVHQKGSVSMALLGNDPDSASCQFFICNTRQKDWDGHYTVFAQLVGQESFETLDRLMTTEINDRGRPIKSLYMRSVRLIDAPPEGYASP